MLLFALTSMLGAPSFETLPASLSASTAKGWEEVIREIDTPPHGSVSGRDSRLKNASLAEASLGLSRMQKERAHGWRGGPRQSRDERRFGCVLPHRCSPWEPKAEG